MEKIEDRHRIPRRREWLEVALTLWFLLAFAAVYFACADLWDLHERFTPIFLGLTMLAGAPLARR